MNKEKIIENSLSLIDNFEGNDIEYIEFLREHIKECEERIVMIEAELKIDMSKQEMHTPENTIKSGDLVTFKTHSFPHAETYKGVVEYIDQLGLVVFVDGVKYEMRKALNIRKIQINLKQNTEKMEIQEIEIGKIYHLKGDIENGYVDGKPYISPEEVTRVIKRVTDTHIICECDRKFLINENLTITIPAYRKYFKTK